MRQNKILIIDDTEIRESLCRSMQLIGYETKCSKDVKSGLESARQWQPDLIISDISCSDMEGFGLLYALSKDEDLSTVPVVFISDHDEKSEMRRALQLGADDYLLRPIDESELFQAIENRLKKVNALKKQYDRNPAGYESFLTDAKSISDLNSLSEQGHVRKFKKKESIFREGQYPQYFYLIETGEVKMFKSNDEGKQYITNIYSAGDFFGFLPILENVPYTESAETIEESRIYQIPAKDFDNILHHNWGVARKFIELISNNLIETEQRLLDLAYNSVRKRVAQALVFINDKERSKHQSNGVPHLSISRDDLASIAGTSVESAVRALAEFKTEGLIEVSGKEIALKNLSRLEHLRN